MRHQKLKTSPELADQILHLERKFTTATETFIVNQINALENYGHCVFTTEFLNTLEVKATVYAPEKGGFLSDKVLTKKHRRFFNAQHDRLTPRLIHSHYITDAVVFRPFTMNKDLPKICSCYGYDVSVIPVKFKFLYRSFYKKVFTEYDMFLAMTDEMKKDLLEIGCPAEKIKVHYHGIDTKRFDLPRKYSLRADSVTLLTVASLYEVKGHLSVLKALVTIKENHPNLNISYRIVGAGPLENQLTEFVQANRLSNSVKFLGAIKHGSEFNDQLIQADIFLHPSVTTKDNDKEGIPGALVEAMASGLPVIATYHGGIPAVITDGETGFLVKENDFKAIADHIVALCRSEKLRTKIGTTAKVYAAKHLDVFEKAKNLSSIYEALILEKRTKSTNTTYSGQ